MSHASSSSVDGDNTWWGALKRGTQGVLRNTVFGRRWSEDQRAQQIVERFRALLGRYGGDLQMTVNAMPMEESFWLLTHLKDAAAQDALLNTMIRKARSDVAWVKQHVEIRPDIVTPELLTSAEAIQRKLVQARTYRDRYGRHFYGGVKTHLHNIQRKVSGVESINYGMIATAALLTPPNMALAQFAGQVINPDRWVKLSAAMVNAPLVRRAKMTVLQISPPQQVVPSMRVVAISRALPSLVAGGGGIRPLALLSTSLPRDWIRPVPTSLLQPIQPTKRRKRSTTVRAKKTRPVLRKRKKLTTRARKIKRGAVRARSRRRRTTTTRQRRPRTRT